MARNKLSAAEKQEIEQRKIKRQRQTIILLCLAIFTTTCAIMLAIKVIPHEVEIAESRREYAALPRLPETPRIVWSTLDYHNQNMQRINSDYVGVIRVEGTTISYPVVRGNDNVKYLTTSFGGSEDISGTLFMDYRCVGENVPHIIIYGHHAGDVVGNEHMFGSLDAFLNEQYIAEHNIITFIENDRLYEYEIISARITDIYDPAYYLDFSVPESFDAFLKRNNAPSDATQILTLSTCIGDGSDDRRIVVQGILRHISLIEERQILIATYTH